MHIKPEETSFLGEFKVVDGKLTRNEICHRIDFLITHYLRKVAGGGWETLYQDPSDGRYWELTYPEGEMHGGGPPRLRSLPPEEAEGKYGKLSKDPVA